MYPIAVLVLLFFLYITASFSSSAAALIDIPSLIIVLFFSFPMKKALNNSYSASYLI